MNNYEDILTPDMVDISIEEFDSMNEEYEFSDEYKRAKKEMLKKYRRSKLSSLRKHVAKAAVAACVLVIGAPLAVNAATDGEFFARIWGNQGKKNIASHDEVVYEKEKDANYTVTYPQVDYAEIDPEKAESLIGENASFKPVEYTFNEGTKLTVLKTVTDGDCMVAEFILEKDGGVDCLNYSQLDNEAKGAWIKDDSTIFFNFEEYDGKIYLDLDKSTDDKLYCYDYMTFMSWKETTGHITSDAVKSLVLEVEEYPCGRLEYYEMRDSDPEKYKELSEAVNKGKIEVPLKEKLDKVSYESESGGSVMISPISMDIDMNVGLGLDADQACDPWSAYYVAIHYKDGSTYVINEHEYRDIHSCDVEIDNSSYVCGTLDIHLNYLFNRLVDEDEIDYIQVNEVEYRRK